MEPLTKHDLFKQCSKIRSLQHDLNERLTSIYSVAIRLVDRSPDLPTLAGFLTVLIFALESANRSWSVLEAWLREFGEPVAPVSRIAARGELILEATPPERNDPSLLVFPSPQTLPSA